MIIRSVRSRPLAGALVALCVCAGALAPAGAALARRPAGTGLHQPTTTRTRQPAGVGLHQVAPGLPPVVNAALLQRLNLSERAALAHHGFVVTAPPAVRDTRGIEGVAEWLNQDAQHAVYWQYYDLYYENYALGIPNFVTSDAVLHTFHVIYDQTLVALERAVLVEKLARLSTGLMASAVRQYSAVRDPRVKAAARLNLGYVAVAAGLLNPGARPPAEVAAPVARELALIAAHHGFAPSPLFGYAVDYSKFVPRGHYTGTPALSRYFQAMTWYGLLAFHLNGADAALQTRQALLLVDALRRAPDLMALWAAVFDPITAWVGRSDDLTVRDYAALLARVYGSTPAPGALADDGRLARFMALARALPNPQISGDFVVPGQNPAVVGKGMRLFGQRFVPDAAIMQALIYDRVGTRQQPRVWPMGLDVAAGLGSRRAASLLTGPLGQNRYAHYATQLAAVERGYARLPVAAWHQNLYWSWLDTLRAVWGPVPPAAPAFMQSAAWTDKSLVTGLSSWAELRHDTLLYVKQPGGFGGGGQATPPSVAYVEPVPLVYARLLALALQMKATLLREGVLNTLPQTASPLDTTNAYIRPSFVKGEQGYHAALDEFASLVALLERISVRELLGQAVAANDMQALIEIETPLAILTQFFLDNGTPHLLPVDKQVAAIADVFTEPASGRVLEVGVGDVLPLYAVVTIGGRHWLARGGVFSYYEFPWPMQDRLTDSAWRHLPHRPDQPAWTADYIAH